MRVLGLLTVALALVGCFADAGAGTDPPPNRFNYPVGLAVSPNGNVLYAANSNFDLQWNGGTLQSYDLAAIRRDAIQLISDRDGWKRDHQGILVNPADLDQCGATTAPQGAGLTLGQQCAPPVRAEAYFKSAAVIGAFATDLQLSADGTRLFTPVRGDASLTWADVGGADPFRIDCGAGPDGRCDAAHRAGNNPDEPGNSRHVTLPGEPFGMAQSEDGGFIALTHQTDTKTSLLRSGSASAPQGATPIFTRPSLQFVFDGVNGGGVGLVAVPHDLQAFAGCELTDPFLAPGSAGFGAVDAAKCDAVKPRPAFLQTSRAVPKIDLLRVYEDEGYAATPSQPSRPYMQREAEFDVIANAGNFDSRGIAIDSTPRLKCRAAVRAMQGTISVADARERMRACARIPARVFIANRSPASLLVGEVGVASADGVTFDPDRLTVRTSIPLSFGPSRVYLAPVVESDGTLGLRVFVVCFDASTIYVIDPNANIVENIIRVDDGPFAMTFDPFSFEDVASAKKAPSGYRFGYVAIFRNSHLQMIDLDNSVKVTTGGVTRSTFENVVYTLGEPIAPKGGL